MAKIQLKSDNINPFGGLFSILKQFDACGLRHAIDSTLGKRGSTKAAFTYGDVFASLFGSYLCGGDCIEDIMDIKPFWDGRDKLRICSSDVVLRTLRKLSCDNVTYESTQNKSYDFNVNEKMNSLLLKCLRVTGQLCPGDCVSLDFDHQFIPADKKDAKYSYKKADGYFPGVASIGGLIVGWRTVTATPMSDSTRQTPWSASSRVLRPRAAYLWRTSAPTAAHSPKTS